MSTKSESSMYIPELKRLNGVQAYLGSNTDGDVLVTSVGNIDGLGVGNAGPFEGTGSQDVTGLLLAFIE